MPPLLEEIIREYGSNPFEALWFMFSHGLGFLILTPTMIYYGWKGYVQYIQERFKIRTKYVMYQIQVPQLHEQSMKAVEQIFVHLYGSQDDPNFEEKYWLGFVQPPFALEIVSRGGYIDFYVRGPEAHKEMLLAAFYAQYPDALLTEVEDYSHDYTVDQIMNDEVSIYGSELKLANDDIMPIKSWPAWEHNLAGVAVDPLASILEMMSRLQPGEEWWLQILAQPMNADAFRERAQKAIDDIVEPGGAAKTPDTVLDKAIIAPVQVLGAVHDQIWPGDYGTATVSDRLPERQRLTDPEREFVQEVDRKMSRWPYNTKIRWMYFAEPNKFNYTLGRRGMLGALQQFRFINWFIEGSLVKIDPGALFWRKIRPIPRTRKRARRMLWAYQSRDMSRGEHDGFVLNTEELASIFHFPQMEVRAPFVSKATSRGVEPPTQLNYEGRGLFQDGGVSGVQFQNIPFNETAPPSVNVVPEGVVQPSVQPGAQPIVQPGAPIQPQQPQAAPPVDESEPAPPSNLPFA